MNSDGENLTICHQPAVKICIKPFVHAVGDSSSSPSLSLPLWSCMQSAPISAPGYVEIREAAIRFVAASDWVSRDRRWLQVLRALNNSKELSRAPVVTEMLGAEECAHEMAVAGGALAVARRGARRAQRRHPDVSRGSPLTGAAPARSPRARSYTPLLL